MKINLVIVFLLLVINANAQEFSFKEKFKQRLFHGTESQLEFVLYPFRTIYDNNNSVTSQWESASLNLGYFFRLNILEFDSDQSISIETHPMIGLRLGLNRPLSYSSIIVDPGLNLFGFGSFHLPTMINYHIGKGATKNSTYRFGLTFSIGKEFRIDPLWYFSDFPIDRTFLKRDYQGYIFRIGLMREKKRLHQIFIQHIVYDGFSFLNLSGLRFGINYPQTNFSLGLRFFRNK